MTSSKYGESKDLEKMARLTSEIVNLFERISIESGAGSSILGEGCHPAGSRARAIAHAARRC